MTTITRHPDPPADTQGYILDDEGIKYIAIVFPDGDLRFSRVGEGSIGLTPSLIQAIQTLAIAHDIIPPPNPIDAEVIAALKEAQTCIVQVIASDGGPDTIERDKCVHALEYIGSILKRINQ